MCHKIFSLLSWFKTRGGHSKMSCLPFSFNQSLSINTKIQIWIAISEKNNSLLKIPEIATGKESTSYKEQRETQNSGGVPHPRWCPLRQQCVETKMVEALLPLTPPAEAAWMAKAAGTFQQLKFSQQLKHMEGLHLVTSRSSRQPAGMTRSLPFLCHWALLEGWDDHMEQL